MILESLVLGGSYARDLIKPVSELYGKPMSVQMISNTLSTMEKDGEVRKVPEYGEGVLKRHKWFRVRGLWKLLE